MTHRSSFNSQIRDYPAPVGPNLQLAAVVDSTKSSRAELDALRDAAIARDSMREHFDAGRLLAVEEDRENSLMLNGPKTSASLDDSPCARPCSAPRAKRPEQNGYAVDMTVSNSLACCAIGRRWTTVSYVTSAAGPFTGQSLE
jgi:hypothetical protein